MALYVYNTTDGTLVSWCPEDVSQVASPEELKAKGLDVVTGLPTIDDTHKWDAATKTIVSAAAPVLPRMVGTGKWVLRFTPAEFQAITTSTDQVVAQFVFAINHTIELDLNDPIVVLGVQYLVAKGLITSDRVSAVLS